MKPRPTHRDAVPRCTCTGAIVPARSRGLYKCRVCLAWFRRNVHGLYYQVFPVLEGGAPCRTTR